MHAGQRVLSSSELSDGAAIELFSERCFIVESIRAAPHRWRRASGEGSLVRQAAKRQRAQPSESGCDRDALQDPTFAAEAGLTSDRGAEEKQTARHHRARSCRVAGPAVVPAPHGAGRAGQASDGYARKDRDPAQVMHLPATSWAGRDGIGRPPVLLAGTLVRKVANVIGDEQSRANQPDAHSRDERWDGAGSNAPPIGARETRARA